jgi:hypothetical protein
MSSYNDDVEMQDVEEDEGEEDEVADALEGCECILSKLYQQTSY